MWSSRRDLLRTLGAVAGSAAVGAAAGCLELRSKNGSRSTATAESGVTATPGSREPTTYSMGEMATSDRGATLTVSDPRLRKVIETPAGGVTGHQRPVGHADSQFVIVHASATDPIAELDLMPVLDGVERASRTYPLAFSPGTSGRLAVAAPISSVDAGAVAWRPADGQEFRWTLPDRIVELLGRTPRFIVEGFDVPASMSRGDPFKATVTVRNEGDREGRFLGTVLDRGPSSVPLAGTVTQTVPTDATVSIDVAGRPIEAEREELTALLDWGLGRRTATVALS